MAIIKCLECGREISDKAASCVGCGCPLGMVEGNDSQDDEELKGTQPPKDVGKKQSNASGPGLKGCLGGIAVVVGIILFFAIPHVGAVWFLTIGLLAIGSSLIPSK